MSTPASARRTVIFLMLVSVAATSLRLFLNPPEGTPSSLIRPRVVIGGLIVAFVLLALTDRAPRLASGFAVVITITAVGEAVRSGAVEGPTKRLTTNTVRKATR